MLEYLGKGVKMYEELREFRDKFFSSEHINLFGEEITYMINAIKKIDSQESIFLKTDYSKEFSDFPIVSRKKDELIDEAMTFFNGQLKFNNQNVNQNIHPPIFSEAVALQSMVNLYNPNGAWDLMSANAHLFERELKKQIVNLTNWDNNDSDATMTFGGKGCLMYAIKMGINRTDMNVNTDGLTNKKVIITTKNAHYTIEATASLMGIGSNNVIRIDDGLKGCFNFDEFKRQFRDIVDQNKKIATIILSGGDTINIDMDEVKSVKNFIKTQYNDGLIDYQPFIHFDTVVSWPWLSFKDYDFEQNELNLSSQSIKDIHDVYQQLSEVDYADSMGVDFHKIGFMNYPASMFLTKHKQEFRSLVKKDNLHFGEFVYGENFVQHHTIEHSRSVAPILGSWYTMQRVGLNILRQYIAQMIDNKHLVNAKIKKNNYECLNPNSKGFCNIFYVVPVKYQNINQHRLTKEQVNEINIFNQNFAKSFLDKEIFISLIPNYKKINGNSFSGLRFYSSSSILDEQQINQLMDDFNCNFKNFEINDKAKLFEARKNLNHVPY